MVLIFLLWKIEVPHGIFYDLLALLRVPELFRKFITSAVRLSKKNIRKFFGGGPGCKC